MERDIRSSRINGIDGWQRYTSRKVEEPLVHVQPIQITNLHRFTDYVKGLTAVKNDRLKACFVAELDPAWNPNDEDLHILMLQMNPIDTTDVEKFETMAGGVIAKMCSDFEIYWFASFGPILSPEQIKFGDKGVTENSYSVAKDPNKVFVTEKLNGGNIGNTFTERQEPFSELPGNTESPTTFSSGFQEPPTDSNPGELIEPPLVEPNFSEYKGGTGELIEPPLKELGSSGTKEEFVATPLVDNGSSANKEAGKEFMKEPPTIHSIVNDMKQPPIINKQHVKEPKVVPLQQKGNNLPDMDEFYKSPKMSGSKMVQSKEEPMTMAGPPEFSEENLETREGERNSEELNMKKTIVDDTQDLPYKPYE